MIETIILKNGLTIVMEPITSVRSVSFGIWVKNGSRNESPDTNGISHFIEHMLFKGTSRRSAKDIADEIDEIGGQINAYTSKELTCYYTRTLDTHFDTALDVLADMFFNSKFDDTEIKKECNVILEEINMYEDTPEDQVYDILQAEGWKNNPLGFSVLGSEKTISTFNNKTFRSYFDSNYRPEKTVIAIAGSFEPQETVKKIETYFGGFSSLNTNPVPDFKTIYTPAFIKKEKDIEQMHLCFGFPGLPVGSERAYVLACLNTVFGGGMSSRLFQKIREEKGLVYSIYSYNAGFVDTGIFTIYAAMNPKQVEKAISLIINEIKSLHTDRISEEYLKNTKEQLKSNLLLSLESSSSRMSSLGRAQLLLNRVISPDELIQKIDAITIEKIYEVIGSVFDLGSISVSAVGKIKGMNFHKLLDNAR